jgi:hypothetical protein
MERRCRVEVRTRFDGGWSSGFEIESAEVDDDEVRYRVRRCSDGYLLPALFAPQDLRPSQNVEVVSRSRAGV